MAMLPGGSSTGAPNMSDIMKVGEDRVSSAIDDVGKALDKITEYANSLFESQDETKLDKKTSDVSEALGANTDPRTIDDATFNAGVNEVFEGDDLEVDTTNNLKTIILLEMATDTDGDGKIDSNFDTNGDGQIDANIDTEKLITDFFAQGLTSEQITKFHQVLAATLMAYDTKTELEGYVN